MKLSYFRLSGKQPPYKAEYAIIILIAYAYILCDMYEYIVNSLIKKKVFNGKKQHTKFVFILILVYIKICYYNFQNVYKILKNNIIAAQWVQKK